MRDEELRAGWTAGLSAKAIGDSMGLSKNAVLGRVHRLGLPVRTSPISRHLTPEEKAEREQARELRRIRAEGEVTRREQRVKAAKAAPPELPARSGRVTACCWLEGARKPWLRCDAPTLGGSSYCPQHHAIVYVPVQRVVAGVAA